MFLLLGVLIVVAVLNLVLGSTPTGFVISLVLPISIGGLIHFKSRNKADGHLRDWVLFYRRPGVYTANRRSRD